MNNLLKAYRPLFFEDIADVTNIPEQASSVLVSDKSRGLLTLVNLIKDTETFNLEYDVNDYANVNSICYYDGYVYSVYKNCIYRAYFYRKDKKLINKLLIKIPNSSNLTGIAVTENTIYLVTENQAILSCDRQTLAIEIIGSSKGIGFDNLCYHDEKLFIVDSKEQTVYIFDLATRSFIYEILTPFENPTGITAVEHKQLGNKLLYVCYARPSFDVYDTGDSEFKLQIDTTVKDNFIYPLLYHYDAEKRAVLSNSFLGEMYYVEKLHGLPEIAEEYHRTKELEWKISLPMNTDRQELIAVETIGNFPMQIETIAEEENRQVAVFSIPEIDLATERRVFGWKCLVKMSGIRYCINENEVREISAEELEKYQSYLINEAGLDMDSYYVQKAALEAIENLTEDERKNPLKKVKAIRDYIYSKLTYVMDQYHKGTEEVLRTGEGSCGEYLNVFLSLLRLNNIPTLICGNYKVPAYKMQAGARSLYLSPDFNHVWLKFYLPEYGWFPLESSADDDGYSFRDWGKRYFLSLAWYHLECRIGSYFEDVFDKETGEPYFLAPADLAKKDIKFRVIKELI